jgi:hypothetical protein
MVRYLRRKTCGAVGLILETSRRPFISEFPAFGTESSHYMADKLQISASALHCLDGPLVRKNLAVFRVNVWMLPE